MRGFIELTQTGERKVWVNIDHIVAFENHAKFTRIYTSTNSVLDVDEAYNHVARAIGRITRG